MAEGGAGGGRRDERAGPSGEQPAATGDPPAATGDPAAAIDERAAPSGEQPPTPAELARTLERLRARAEALRARPVSDLWRALGRVGARFLDDDDPLRREALAGLPEAARVSEPMARVILDGMARDWTADPLRRTVERELDDPRMLDGLTDGVMAVGPRLCVQIVSGSVPGVSVHALLRSLLVKAPTLLKPGRGDALLPRLFARGLGEEDAALADALEVVYWPGGATELERMAVRAAEVVVAYGSDDTVAQLRALTPASTRFVGYHHRVGVGIVGREALVREGYGPAGSAVETAAADVARSVALFEQRGCVCPQLVYVEEGGEIGPSDFAAILAEAFSALEEELPGPPVSMEEAGARQQLRGTAELQAASGAVELHHGGQRGHEGERDHGGADGAWTVILEREPVAGPGGGARTVRLRPIADATDLAEALEPLGPHLQSVGYAGLGDRLDEVTEAAGRTGASRVAPFGALSFPPPWWLHDGQGPLRTLLRWVELEG